METAYDQMLQSQFATYRPLASKEYPANALLEASRSWRHVFNVSLAQMDLYAHVLQHQQVLRGPSLKIREKITFVEANFVRVSRSNNRRNRFPDTSSLVLSKFRI